MKMFGTVFFALVMFWCAWVLLAGEPLSRINRTCSPVSWVGTAITTTGSLFSTSAENDARRVSGEMFQTCRYFVFRQFYRDLYLEMRAKAAIASSERGGAQPTSTSGAAGGQAR